MPGTPAALNLRAPAGEPGLDEHRSVWADALRSVADSWRFRARAGRIASHSLPEVLKLAEAFDRAATALDSGPDDRGAPDLENDLHESEERFRLLVESVRDYAIFMLDPTGRITTWNEGARRLKGYEAKEIIGQHFSRFYAQEDRDRRHPEAELELAARDGTYHEEGWRYRKDGSRFWADVTITALRKDGELKGFAKVTRDLTERVEQERALKEANVSLERRVAERTAELVALNKELEGFSYSVSHDLRAPLRAIDGFSKVVLDDFAEGAPLDARGRKYLERIRAGSQRMAGLIDDMLKLARVTRAPLEPVPVDLAVLAREVVASLDKRSGLTVLIPSTLPAVGDPSLLRQVLANLLGNAFKFTSKKTTARVELGEAHEANERRFFVRDDGAGFDMAFADKLFSPFQRLHDHDEFEGTGIGLATVHRIISRHGGRIWAQSEPDQGATFWFTLGASR